MMSLEEMPMTNEFTTTEAHALGTAAFHSGRSGAPAQDFEFMERYAAYCGANPELGSGLALLEAYGNGWLAEQRKRATRELAETGDFEDLPSVIEYRQSLGLN
jgi:hypothetical protein